MLLKSSVSYLVVLSMIDSGFCWMVSWLVGGAGDQIQYTLGKHSTAELHLNRVPESLAIIAGTFICVPILSVFALYTLMVYY